MLPVTLVEVDEWNPRIARVSGPVALALVSIFAVVGWLLGLVVLGIGVGIAVAALGMLYSHLFVVRVDQLEPEYVECTRLSGRVCRLPTTSIRLRPRNVLRVATFGGIPFTATGVRIAAFYPTISWGDLDRLRAAAGRAKRD